MTWNSKRKNKTNLDNCLKLPEIPKRFQSMKCVCVACRPHLSPRWYLAPKSLRYRHLRVLVCKHEKAADTNLYTHKNWLSLSGNVSITRSSLPTLSRLFYQTSSGFFTPWNKQAGSVSIYVVSAVSSQLYRNLNTMEEDLIKSQALNQIIMRPNLEKVSLQVSAEGEERPSDVGKTVCGQKKATMTR